MVWRTGPNNLSFPFLFFFCDRGFELARQALYHLSLPPTPAHLIFQTESCTFCPGHLSHAPHPACFGYYFSDRVLRFLPGATLECDPHAYASCMHQNTWLVFSLTFSGWFRTMILPISASQAAGILGASCLYFLFIMKDSNTCGHRAGPINIDDYDGNTYCIVLTVC
jgi:hypothetical protein